MEHEQLLRRWAGLWRSIISSCLGKTYRPYCRYIRALDFRNLQTLFEDVRFTGRISQRFFAGELASVYIERDLVFNKSSPHARKTIRHVDVFPTLNKIGEAITQNTTLLEELAGHFSSKFLSRWVSRSPRLQSLVLWDGAALDMGLEEAIREHCPFFRSLTIHGWVEKDTDQEFATFLVGLRPHSLGHLEIISHSYIADLSLSALPYHAESLTELRLNGLIEGAILSLGKLKTSTSIRTLVLEDLTGVLELETMQDDIFTEIVDWLSACQDLKDLTIKKFHDGPAILARVLSSGKVSLKKLSLDGYLVRRHAAAAFHVALGDQKQLQSVWLRGDGEDVTSYDLEIMVDGLCRVETLRELVLKDVSDEFEELHIIRLASQLPLLEDFWTSGGEVSHTVLPHLANLKYLKNLTLYALTQFRADHVLDFVSRLDRETQRGFNFSLMAAEVEYDLTDEEQSLIRDVIRDKVDGKFDFVLWRDAEPSDSEDD